MPLSEVIDLIHSVQTYLEEEAPSAFLSTAEDAEYFRSIVRKRRDEGKAENAEKIHRKGLKNQELGQEGFPNSYSERMISPESRLELSKTHRLLGGAITERQGASESKNFEASPTPTPLESRLEPKKVLPQPAQISLKEPDLQSPPRLVEKPMPKQTENSPSEKFTPSSSLTDVRKIFAPLFPQFPLLDSIPSDAIAIKISERWKTKNKTAPISILSLNEPPEQRTLLEQIAKAIDATFAPARVISAESIEKEKQWEAFLSAPGLKVAIACDYTLWQLNHLMSYYKENPTQGTRTLGSISLFLLPDLSLYLKDPLLKRSLWKALCQKLSS